MTTTTPTTLPRRYRWRPLLQPSNSSNNIPNSRQQRHISSPFLHFAIPHWQFSITMVSSVLCLVALFSIHFLTPSFFINSLTVAGIPSGSTLALLTAGKPSAVAAGASAATAVSIAPASYIISSGGAADNNLSIRPNLLSSSNTNSSSGTHAPIVTFNPSHTLAPLVAAAMAATPVVTAASTVVSSKENQNQQQQQQQQHQMSLLTSTEQLLSAGADGELTAVAVVDPSTGASVSFADALRTLARKHINVNSTAAGNTAATTTVTASGGGGPAL